LCIRKFTPGITEILNVVDHDLGRPVVHFNPALSGIDLHKELRRVRDDEANVEVEVQTNDGSWYLLRALPYRTEQNVVDGLVVAFIDITAFKRSEAGRKGVESQLAHERDVLRVVTDTTSSGILIYAPDGNLTFANPQAARVLDVTLESLRNRGYNDPAWEVREPDGSPVPEDQLPFRQTLEQRREIRDRILDVRTGDGGATVRLQVNSAPLLDDQGNVDAIVLTLLRAEEDE
jgi:two-component system CheB/CheR fusion protein